MDTTPEAYWASKDHRRHCPGAPQDPEMVYYQGRLAKELQRTQNPRVARVQADRAWIVMLCRQELITREVAAKILTALVGAEEENGAGGEDYLKRKLGGDEDTASAVNLGRTLQEPMSRLQMRDKLVDVSQLLLDTLETILDVAEANADTIMAGQTHLSHAQPTTYGAYLLSVYDGLARGMEQLDVAYRHTNMNSGGCGALAGTGWPVDRPLVTALLGFHATVEPAYDCEAGQDHPLTILFALTSIVTLLSRTAMDHNIWGMEEVAMIRVPPGWAGVSSMMPQKCIPGSQFERVRLSASDVMGDMMTGLISTKGEPHSDMLPIYEGWRAALRAMCHAERAMGFYKGLIANLECDKERMLKFAREGFSAAPDLAVKLIRDHQYGGRRAHRICATFVRIARERGILACETTGDLLDEAARIADEPEPGLTTEVVRDMLDPVKFMDRHRNLGDPAPEETLRLIGIRRADLAKAKRHQDGRVARIKKAARMLDDEVKAILGEE